MSLPPLVLKSQADKRLRRGHLWVYSNEVDTGKSPLRDFEPGQQAQLLNHRKQSLGVVTVNPNTLICARLVSRDQRYPLNKSLLVHRLQQAAALRRSCFDKPFYRLVFGDADLLPGLVVDRFGDVLVVQIASAGMERVKDDIVQALQQCFSPSGILLRNDHGARELENLPAYVETLGEVADAVELLENDTRFLAPVRSGQKTGWFYDHRVNRACLQGHAAGKCVLDMFSYVGGWGVQAARAGAGRVVCVDASRQALDWVAENAALNGLQARVETRAGKAVEVMKHMIADGERFDIVVLDPPAFIKRRRDQHAGEAAYRHINDMAMRLLCRDGLLVSASCSMHLPRAALTDIIRGAARHLDRHAQLIYQGGQGPDHPIHPAIAETDYLKAAFARVLAA